MTPEMKQQLRGLLVKHEELKNYPYTDTTGHLTIGVGRNLSTRGITDPEALSLLDNDIDYFFDKLSYGVPVFNKLNGARQIVLIDMCFNLGLNGLLAFEKMLTALANADYQLAAEEIINSKAAQQCVERYKRLSSIMVAGEL